jgi:hypothetical protein
MPVVTLKDRSLAVRPLWRADEAHSVCGADQRDKKDAVAFGITVIACFGFAPVPRFLIESTLKKGSLKTPLSGYELLNIPVHLCFTDKEHTCKLEQGH